MLGFVGRVGWRIIDVVTEAGTGYLSLSILGSFPLDVESAV